MKYEEMIKGILKVYGNDSYNVEKVLKDEINSNLYETGGDGFIFEMYNKKFEITRKVTIIDSDNEEFIEEWNFEEL